MNFFLKIFDKENWLWKYNFSTLRTRIHRRVVLKQFLLSMSILGQKSCILGPTIFKIPRPNWGSMMLFFPCMKNQYHWQSPLYLQGVSKVSELFFRNECGIQMSQATPTNFSMLFKHKYGKLFWKFGNHSFIFSFVHGPSWSRLLESILRYGVIFTFCISNSPNKLSDLIRA